MAFSPNPYESYDTVYDDLRQHCKLNFIHNNIFYIQRFSPPKQQKEQNLSRTGYF